MKKKKNSIFPLLLTCFICCSFSMMAQDWSIVRNPSGKLNAVSFADNDIAFAVGGNGLIVKSTDAGQTWSDVNHGLTTQDLNAIKFPSSSVGYIAGAGGSILKTTDGGVTWSNISANLPSGASGGLLLGIYSKNTEEIFVVGNPGLILHTTNGGTTWESRNSVTGDGYLRSISFKNNLVGYVVGNNGLIKQTVDGGITWNDFTPETNPPVSDEYAGLPDTPFGVNLSGGEFGGHYLAQGDPYPGQYGTHYAYPLPEDLDYYNNKGLKLIRLPFRWERVQRELNGALYTFDVDKMKAVVQGANDRGMKIFIDMHNFGRRGQTSEFDLKIIDGPNSGVTRHHLADCWKKLALEFKDYNLWGYDIMNEPHDMGSASWFDIAQEVIDSIREVDVNTPIIICGDRWSSAYYWPGFSDNLKNLYDPSDKLIYQAHLYFDRNESGSYSGTYDSEGTTPQTGVNRAIPFVNWLKENNKKGFIGEYGIPHNDERWNVVLENMLIYLRDNAVTGTYWSAGTRWGGYTLSVDPSDSNPKGTDRPQMSVLERYTLTNSVE